MEHAVGALLRPFQPQLQHKQGSDIDPNRSSVKVSGAETGAVAPTRRSLGGTSLFRGGGAGAGAGATARVAAGDGTIDPASKDGGEGEDEEGRRRERQLQTLRRASIQYLKNMATRDEAPDDRGPAPAGRATPPPAAAAAAAEATAIVTNFFYHFFPLQMNNHDLSLYSFSLLHTPITILLLRIHVSKAMTVSYHVMQCRTILLKEPHVMCRTAS